MPCAICGQTGHNRRTCPQNNGQQSNGNNASTVPGNGNQQPGWLQQFLGTPESNQSQPNNHTQQSANNIGTTEHNTEQSEQSGHNQQHNQQQPGYTNEQLQQAATVSDNTRNYKLKILLKYQLKKICMHYGIPQTGTKISIIKRIIDHRVEQETEYVQPNNLVELLDILYGILFVNSWE